MKYISLASTNGHEDELFNPKLYVSMYWRKKYFTEKCRAWFKILCTITFVQHLIITNHIHSELKSFIILR